MTDQQSTSSVNLFRSSTSSTTTENNALDALGLNSSKSDDFSKELSRASQRAASYNEPSRWRQRAPYDNAQRSSGLDHASASSRSAESTKSPQSSDARPVAVHDERADLTTKHATHSTESTEADGTVVKLEAEKAAKAKAAAEAVAKAEEAVLDEEPVGPAQSAKSAKTAKSVNSEGLVESAASAEQLADGEEVRAEPVAATQSQSSFNADDGAIKTPDLQENQRGENTEVRVVLPELNANPIEIGEIEVLEPGINSGVKVDENARDALHTKVGKDAALVDDQLLTDTSTLKPAEQASDIRVPAASPASMNTVPANGAARRTESKVIATPDSDSDIKGIGNVGGLSSTRLTGGEQLLSAELATRQAALLNTSGKRTHEGDDTLTTEADSPVSAMRLPTRTSGTVNTTGTLPGLHGAPVTADRANNGVPVAAEWRPGSERLIPVEIEGLQGSRQVKQSDIQLQANVQKELLARKAEQESTASSLMQAKQLAQQQMKSTVAAFVPAENVQQTPENMFHSLAGGIVTAPVLQRADVGHAQDVRAPVSMAILQNDADKALASNIRWMVNEGVKSAVVNVTPSGMGPISVSIGVENEQMNVSIVALQGSTREALDSMLPRLREQLVAQGHDSVKLDISDGRSEQSSQGYGQRFSDQHGDREAGLNSQGKESGTNEIGSDGSDDKQLVNLPEQRTLKLLDNGQIRSNYDVYV